MQALKITPATFLTSLESLVPMPKACGFGKCSHDLFHFFDIEIAGQVGPQVFQAICFKKAQAPLA